MQDEACIGRNLPLHPSLPSCSAWLRRWAGNRAGMARGADVPAGHLLLCARGCRRVHTPGMGCGEAAMHRLAGTARRPSMPAGRRKRGAQCPACSVSCGCPPHLQTHQVITDYASPALRKGVEYMFRLTDVVSSQRGGEESAAHRLSGDAFGRSLQRLHALPCASKAFAGASPPFPLRRQRGWCADRVQWRKGDARDGRDCRQPFPVVVVIIPASC